MAQPGSQPGLPGPCNRVLLAGHPRRAALPQGVELVPASVATLCRSCSSSGMCLLKESEDIQEDEKDRPSSHVLDMTLVPHLCSVGSPGRRHLACVHLCVRGYPAT